MDNFHLELSQVQNLAKKDTVIARALVRNGWVDAECVLAAATAAAQDPTGPTLLYRLTHDGKLEEQRARHIEEALERKLAEKARRTTAPEGTPEPAKQSGSPGGDDIVSAARELLQDRDDAERAESVRFFATYLRSELHEDIMVRIVDSGGGGADPTELADATGASRDQVEDILSQWRENDLLGTATNCRFHFAPSPRQKKAIARHLQWWHDDTERERCIEMVREEAYAGYVAHTRERLQKVQRALDEQRASREALEEKLQESAKDLAKTSAQYEEARRNADTLRSELDRSRGEVAQANNMVSLKDQLIAQLMKEKDAHNVLEKDHAELLKKYKELGDEFEKAVDTAREAEQAGLEHMPWRLSGGAMTRAS